ncbi:MAG: hypothetical protein Kow0040_00950 [Thermogutta sp.]
MRFVTSYLKVCGLAVLLVPILTSTVQAAWITKQGVSWDTDWLPTEGSIVHSPVNDPKLSGSPLFVFGSAWSPTGWIISNDHTVEHRTVGDLFFNHVYDSGGKELSINLGPGVGTDNYTSLYSEIELAWGSLQGTPLGFRNAIGNDLAIYENGYPPQKDDDGNWRGGSDVVLVSLGYVENGVLKWTDYRYTVPTNYESGAVWVDTNGNPNDGNFGEGTNWASGPTYLTLIDASDFDLPLGTWITGVRIRNAVYGSDKAEDSTGAGWAALNSNDPSLFPFKDNEGEITSYLHPKYNTQSPRYDPDITVVVPLSSVMPIPEPGLAVALCSGLAALLPYRLLRRKSRCGN